jgi:PAS domain S-box-containing protein
MTALSPGVGRLLKHIHLFSRPQKWFATIALTLLLVVLPASRTTAQTNEPKQVLILMQEDLSWPMFRLIDENVRAALLRGFPEGILIFSEHMDRTHFPDPMSQAQKKTWIQKKYASSKLDLVIEASDFPADIFPSVPLVHISIGPPRKLPGRLAARRDAAGIWVEPGVGKTLEAARRFHPGARQIVVIAGSSPTESLLLDQTRKQLASFSQQLPVIYLTKLGYSEISKRVEALGPESIVLFVSLARDGDGQPLISARTIGKIAAVSGAPVYAVFDAHIGSGAVGGYATRYDKTGMQAGEMGLQFLAGKHPEDAMARSDYLFDWHQLQRWKIPDSMLPAKSIVLNRPPNIWQSYRWYILGAIFLALAETMLLFGLLWQRARKRKFQHSLVDQMAFEKMLAELSTTFINLPEDRVGATIDRSLGRIARLLKLDRITLFEYSPASAEFVATFSWLSIGARPTPAVIHARDLPWYTQPLLRGETIHVSDPAALPEEACAEREYFRKMGSISVATVPLKAGDQLFGAMSFATTKSRVDWTEELVDQLTLVGEIFSNALARKRAQEARFRHAAIVESSDDAIISKSLEGIILSWNAGAQRMFDYTEAEAVGQPIDIVVPEELRGEEQEILERARAGGRIEHYETIRAARNGRRLNVSLTVAPLRDSAGVVVGVSKIARDITEAKRAERILRESEDRFRLVANSAPVLIWMSGTDKLCTFFNHRWLKFTGRSLEQELGHGWTSSVHPDDLEHCMAIFTGSFDARLDFEMEYRLRRFDGEYRWLVDFGVPRFESDGTFCGYIGSCVDITDRRSSEESLHALTGRLISAQEEERARIARELHDDFSQRLALLGIGLGQLWKKLPASEVAGRASVLDILREAKEISSDIHILSHQLHSSKLEHVGLVPALHGLCKEIGDKYKIQIHFTHSEFPLDVPKDMALCLFRVAQEALGNVIKHSGTREAHVELSARAAGISLRISDQGRGFEPDMRNPRAGIGLIGMSERLRLVGGKLGIKSQPNRGTEIAAEVPLVTAEEAAEPKTQVVGR